ncbi:hypothetical protein EZ449_01830 [Pedobacter frigidisoli]|uniref:Uncharacterized protein n=1 Tax=Pedobacter frigidisoli TaxID=2530455 RepID=A0A4R0P757_9SPHI|nr:hypothetical protein [Pedobacter frigidisoli]TCD12810.1 hypothetical protein EZ449_01830 [Pedobacter frigidisoli]
MRKIIRTFLLGTFVVSAMMSCSKNSDDDMVPDAPTFTGPNPSPTNLSVRVIYIVPSDKTLNKAYTDAAGN